MTSARKLYLMLLADSAISIKFRDFERLLRAFGFTHERTVGSHRQYVHPVIPRPFPIQPEGKDAKRYQVRELLAIIEAHGLYMTE